MKAGVGHHFVAAVLASENLDAYLQLGEHRHYMRPNEEPLHDYLRKHVSQFGELPSVPTLEVHTGEPLPEPKEGVAYYFEHLRKRYVMDQLKGLTTEASKLTKGKDADPDEAARMLTEGLMGLHVETNRHEIRDLRVSATEIMADYMAEKAAFQAGKLRGVGLGWDYLDRMMGGGRAGDLVSLIARPGEGKTWLMAYSARHVWAHQQRQVLFVSMEMDARLIELREAALHAKIDPRGLKLGTLTTHEEQKLKQALAEMSDPEAHKKGFYVVDGAMTARVSDLRSLCLQTRPDVIYVDGAYLMRVDERTGNKFERMGIVCDQLKSLGTELRVPVVSTWQFNKRVSKKGKKGEKRRTMDDIYGSDVISQNSSVILGLLQEESPETIHRRTLDVLKGRGGEVGEFVINWDFGRMDFSQQEKDYEEALAYVG